MNKGDNEDNDILKLADNNNVQKMLEKNGGEKVIFSDMLIKINRKEKEQSRVMLLTDKALYNLLCSTNKQKRRISLEAIAHLTVSVCSPEFVVQIPDEYDYRFKSPDKDKICKLIRAAYAKRMKILHNQGKCKGSPNTLGQSFSPEESLKDVVFTRTKSRQQTREDRERRKLALAAIAHDSDNEEAKAESSPMSSANNPNHKISMKDFDLLKVLGRGSFGKVMQVRLRATGKIYAVKILKKDKIVQRHQVEHTNAERKILEALEHPFLMTLRYAFQNKEKLYFVLDYYQGGELFFHLKAKNRFHQSIAKIYIAEIGLALGKIHSLGCIYRDLKPENILLDDHGHCCLTDFGLAKDMTNIEKAHTFCGTPEYLAPEIICKTGHDKGVDWWSLGILLYELTVGIPPFYSENVNDMYTKIQHGMLRFPPFMGQSCKSLIIALLQRDPKRRLGHKNDVEEFKKHEFFSDIDWEKLYRKEIQPAYKPPVIAGGHETNCFSTSFTSEPVVDSCAPASALTEENQDAFAGFTYKPKDSALY